jgi:hypothetical protein
MSQYFDKDFFKFLLTFFAIILLSISIIVAVTMYKDDAGQQVDPMSNIANSQP